MIREDGCIIEDMQLEISVVSNISAKTKEVTS